jgi:hypothetical protein
MCVESMTSLNHAKHDYTPMNTLMRHHMDDQHASIEHGCIRARIGMNHTK